MLGGSKNGHQLPIPPNLPKPNIWIFKLTWFKITQFNYLIIDNKQLKSTLAILTKKRPRKRSGKN